MISWLRVNFYKSNIFGINFCEWSMNVASFFLACSIDHLPFKFLGVMVGDITKREYIWKELVRNIRKMTSIWKGRHLSLGGRVVLINSTLNSIPIYTLSFYKAPIKVLKDIKIIQRKLMWRGDENKRTIHWVSWNIVCKPKDYRGLGIKNIEGLDKALLIKWK